MLQKLGTQLLIARNGKEALLLLSTHRFDLVLMDIQMRDGWADGAEKSARAKERRNSTCQLLP